MKKKKLTLKQIKVQSFVTELDDYKTKFALAGNGGGDDSELDNGCKGDKKKTDGTKEFSWGSWCIVECLAPLTNGCGDAGTVA